MSEALMPENSVQITFGADISGLTSGASAARSALQGIRPDVAALEAALSSLSSVVSAAFKQIDAGPLASAISQAVGGVAQLGQSLASSASQVSAWNANLAATAQSSSASAGALGAMAGAVSQMSSSLAQQAGGLSALAGGMSAITTQSSNVRPALEAAAQGLSALSAGALLGNAPLSAIAGTFQSTAAAATPLVLAISQLVENWSGLVGQVSPLAQALQAVASTAGSVKSVFDDVDKTITGVNASIGSVSQALTSLNGVLSAAKDFLDGASRGMVGLDAAADANPVGAMVTVVSALIKGLIDLTVWLARIGALGDAWDALKTGAQTFLDTLRQVWDALGVVGTAIVDVLTHHSFDNLKDGFASLSRDMKQSTADANKLADAMGRIAEKGAASLTSDGIGPAVCACDSGGHSGAGATAAASGATAITTSGAMPADGLAVSQAQAQQTNAVIANGVQSRVEIMESGNAAMTVSNQDAASAQVTIAAAAAAHVVTTVKTSLASVTQSWSAIITPITSDVGRMFEGMLNGTETFRQGMLKLGEDIENGLFRTAERIAAKWIATELAKSTATAAGVAQRGAAEATGARTSVAVSGTSGLKQVMNDAYQAAAGAYKALSGVPIVGPILGAAAAAAAFTAVAAFAGNLTSAAGGWGEVPYDGAMAQLHKSEMVLPASLANPMRQMLSDYAAANFNAPAAANTNGGGDTHNHYYSINAMDGPSFRGFLRGNADHLSTVLQEMGRRGQPTG
jgi:ABC-type transporter Mla subunit MlaD